jgi:hypothetical protein
VSFICYRTRIYSKFTSLLYYYFFYRKYLSSLSSFFILFLNIKFTSIALLCKLSSISFAYKHFWRFNQNSDKFHVNLQLKLSFSSFLLEFLSFYFCYYKQDLSSRMLFQFYSQLTDILKNTSTDPFMSQI